MKVTTIAGVPGESGYKDGRIEDSLFCYPNGIVADLEGNLIIADTFNYKIRKISVNGEVSTIAGTTSGNKDGPVKEAKFGFCNGITVTSDGTIYVADSSNNAIRRISNGFVSTLAGGEGNGHLDGKGKNAKFNYPYGISLESEGSLLVAESSQRALRRVTMDGTVTTIIKGQSSQGVCVYGKDIYVSDFNCINKISEGKPIPIFKVNSPSGITWMGGYLFSNSFSTCKIYRGEEHFAGTGIKGHKDGDLLEAQFSGSYGITTLKGAIYITDYENHCIRKIQIYEEWSLSTHKRSSPFVQEAVKIMLLMRNRNTLWRIIPRELVFEICKMVDIVVIQ